MADTLSAAMAFSQEDYLPPQATVSLSETSLESCLMTPGATSPESSYSIKEEQVEGEDSKKPTKKRKSWGQELPTPKTNLPPRKRAKTEDEKEQRRIERVLRNRQAAQSSRERKRQEVEKLEGEKQSIEQQNESLKQRLMAAEHEKFLLHQRVAKMEAQMEIMRKGSSLPNVSTPPMGPDLLEDSPIIKEESDDYHFSLPTPQSTQRTTSIFSSPATTTYSDTSTPATTGLGLDILTPSADMTQHPAAMLCDLQCHCDPLLYPDSHLHHVDFSSLFTTDPPTIEDPLFFFKDGFTASGAHDDLDANGFAFDSMVDLDACQPTTNPADNRHIQNNDDDLSAYSDVYTRERSPESYYTMSQAAATSSAQQPLLGAPS